LAERYSEATIFVDPASELKNEEVLRAFWMQIFGMFAGIGICLYSKVGIFLELFRGNAPIDIRVDYIFTGILIGAGSQPVHYLIQFITQRKVQKLKSEREAIPALEPTPSPSAVTEVEAREEPAEVGRKVAEIPRTLPPPPAPAIDVPYDGGVDRELLERRHVRLANPSLIVYHHTALHSETTFADLVKLIKDKGWITGYNCVVTADGEIHSFCRWDRFGNHAKGYNRNSLGIALNGNFEPDPRVPFANVDGRFGELRPTDEQLNSAARVVALWSHLYGIPLDWERAIIPHRAVSPKTCPGSDFPYEQFRKLIEFYFTSWEQSTEAQQELLLYRQKQYLFVNQEEVA